MPAKSDSERSESAPPVVGRRSIALVILLPLLVMAAAGFGLALWLTATAPANEEALEDPNLFRQDFRGRKVDEQFWKYTPADAAAMMHEEPEGLRISVPPAKTNVAVGIVPKFPVKGDCEITMSYELLPGKNPSKGRGVGVSLYVKTELTSDAISLSHFRRGESMFYKFTRTVTNAEGKRDSAGDAAGAVATSGRLRLMRQGQTIRCLVAAKEADEFLELGSFEVRNEDLSYVRLAAENASTDVPVEVRIRDFEIRMVGKVQELPRKSGTRTWLLAAEFLGLLTTSVLSLGAGVWLYVRKR